MTDKGKKSKTEKDSKPEKDSAKTEPASKKTTPEKPEVIPPEASLPSSLTPSPKSKKEKKSSGILGIAIFFFLIIAAGIGAGGYYLYQEQMKFQNETLAKLSQLEAQLSALDTEADQARQNKQSLDTLNQELQQFKTEMDTTLKTHQSSLATLDEDVMRLKEKVVPPAEVPTVSPVVTEGMGIETEPVPGEFLPETSDPEGQDDEPLEDTDADEDPPDQESQKFVEWMENFFRAIWNWFAGLFS